MACLLRNIYLSPTDWTKASIKPWVNQMISLITTMVQNVPLTNLLTQKIKSQALKDPFSSLITPLQELYCLSYERHNQLIISSSTFVPSEWRTSQFHTSTAIDIILMTSLFASLVVMGAMKWSTLRRKSYYTHSELSTPIAWMTCFDNNYYITSLF